MLAAYRATGADPPFGDPRGYHGVGMEGYFWRITHAAAGAVVVVLLAVNRDAAGGTWGMLALAAHPGGFVRAATVEHAAADRRALRVRAGAADAPALEADDERLRVDLGPGARVDAAFEARVPWPRGWAFGGIGPAQAIPGLSQYWHPHLLGARVRGSADAGAASLDLDGATAYAEKNWGAAGHPPAWWWGQAHGFARDDVCVAFAGGLAALGPVRLRGRSARHRIEIAGHANGTAPHRLPVPVPAERRRRDGLSAMHLAGALHVRVRRGGRTLFEGASALAGLERGLGPLSARPGPEPTPARRAAG